MKIKIAARHSDLAQIQAYTVGQALEESDPNIEVEYFFRESLGDKNLTDPLWKLPEQGVFTQDFYKDLVEGEHDLVVHSWKDLPVEERDETEIYATLDRADMRDFFIMRKDRIANVRKTKKLRVLSSSPRRAYNLENFFKWSLPFEIEEVTFESVRGNVPTRIKKFLEQDVDGMIVAKAAFDRLLSVRNKKFKSMQKQLAKDFKNLLWQVLPLKLNPAAAAQGALAIEVRRDRGDLKVFLDKINKPLVKECVELERKILASYGGGCHQKIGISYLERGFGKIKILQGLTDQGVVLNDFLLTETASQKDNQTDSKKSLTEWPKAKVDNIYPTNENEESIFTRESYKIAEEKLLGESLYVARTSALPENFSPDFETLVWAAGINTWKKLAAREVWVYGCSESLGENEDFRLNSLLDELEGVDWLKLTHKDGYKGAIKRQLATYELKEKLSKDELEKKFIGKTHFYWKSFSSFNYIKDTFPEIIKSGYHACGPGNTYEAISKDIKKVTDDPNRLKVFLDLSAWKKEVLEL